MSEPLYGSGENKTDKWKAKQAENKKYTLHREGLVNLPGFNLFLVCVNYERPSRRAEQERRKEKDKHLRQRIAAEKLLRKEFGNNQGDYRS
jgi:protoporphyrinogen oxidase